MLIWLLWRLSDFSFVGDLLRLEGEYPFQKASGGGG